MAIFRIVIGTVLFWEILQLYLYRHLIFDTIPFLSFGNIDFKYALLVWLAVIIALILGLFTRVVTILNYALSLVFIATINNFGNHMLNVFMGINFLLMFTDVSRVISVDAIFARLRLPSQQIYATKISVLHYYSFIFMGVALVYFISLFDKLFTDYWRNGLVIWKFLSVPAEFARMDYSILLNNEYLMRFLAYFALVFESVFIFICFKKRYRLLVLSCGLFLHLGILLFFPFTPFSLGFLALYILLVPLSFWSYLKLKLTYKSKTTNVFLVESKWSKPLILLLTSFDVFKYFTFIIVGAQSVTKLCVTPPLFWLEQNNNKRLVEEKALRYILLRLLVFVPLGLLLYLPCINSYLYRFIKRLVKLIIVSLTLTSCTTYLQPQKKLNFYKIKLISFFLLFVLFLQIHAVLQTKFAKVVALPKGIVQVHHMARVVFGIGTHGVFTHDTKAQNLYSIAIVYTTFKKDIWLPLTKPNGQADYYKEDPVRRRSFFSSMEIGLDSVQLNTYVRDFTAFWSFNNNVDLDSALFNVSIKKLEIPETWEKDIYKKNIEKSWLPLGQIKWKDTLYTSNLNHLKLIKD